MIPCVLLNCKVVMGQAPLFEVYLPEYQACYDKVMQWGIFNKKELTDEVVTHEDVAYWDCLSDQGELYIKPLRMFIRMKTQTGKDYAGDYLFTIDWGRTTTPCSQWNVWNEHKQKNFFFDERTGALVCGPNNRQLYFDKSLSHDPPKKPFFKVFEGTPSHESLDALGKTTKWNYED